MDKYRTLFVTERGARHQRDALEAAPPELDVLMLRQPSRGEMLAYLPGTAFVISERTGAIDAQMLACASDLQLIVRLGSMAHDIDLTAARATGVAVCLQPQWGVTMVAEHAVMAMLALSHRLRETGDHALRIIEGVESRRTDEDTFAYNWTHRVGIGGLEGRTVAILGFGEIGAELARRLRGWDCRVLYHRRRRLPVEVETELGIVHAGLEHCMSESDFLVSLLPYSEHTDRLLGAGMLGRLKPTAFLVSCGSGSVVDEGALAAALREGRIAGAAMDTFEWEPLKQDNPLRMLALENPEANLLLTPHVAAGAPSAGQKFSRKSDFQTVVRFLRGEPLSGLLT